VHAAGLQGFLGQTHGVRLERSCRVTTPVGGAKIAITAVYVPTVRVFRLLPIIRTALTICLDHERVPMVLEILSENDVQCMRVALVAFVH
jgi:hypothetical protein